MIRTLLAALAIISVCGAAVAQSPPKAKSPPVQQDTPLTARIRAALKGYLRDEKTARISVVRPPRHGSVSAYGKTQTGQLVCAQVNAIDKHGAYAGYRPFLFVMQDRGVVGVWQHGMLRGSDRVIEAECGKPRRR